MREMLAVRMAAFTGLLVLVLSVLFALIQNPVRGPVQIPSLPKEDSPGYISELPSRLIIDRINIELGKTLYDTLKCRTCHSIGGEGNRRNPLDGLGNSYSADEIRQWIVSPDEIDPDIKKPDYSYLSQDHLDLLVKYIQSLK